MPILAIIDHATDYGSNIIDKSESGLWARADDKERILTNFDRLYTDKVFRDALGENGYRFLVTECTIDKTYERIINQLYE